MTAESFSTSTVDSTVPYADTERAIGHAARAAVEAPVGRTTGWWGMVLLICTEGATFAVFLASYFYLRFDHGGPWPPAADKVPHLYYTSIGTGILVASCALMALAVRATPRDRRGALALLLFVVFGAGCVFVSFQTIDYLQEMASGSTPAKDAYGSLLYLITGLHLVHVVAGLVMLIYLMLSGLMGRIGSENPWPTRIVALYWYFLAVLAVAIYGTVYISPYLQ
jgi:cytochrome c oxidase subunit 3/cytochrome c oxidase subunit I+III